MGLHQIQTVVRPTTIEEAWEVRVNRPKETRFLGGGIDLVLYTSPTVSTLIDLAGLGLEGVRLEGGGLAIGATTTLGEAGKSTDVRDYVGGFLPRVLHQVASPLQRNVATLGGAAARAHPWSDVVLALLVLDASLEVFDGTRRVIPAAAYYDARLHEVPPLILAVRLPSPSAGARAAFEKFGRTGFDVGVLNCGCYGAMEDGVCRTVRVAVGGTPSLAQRLLEVERVVEGERWSQPLIDEAAATAARVVAARDDRRATEAYRRVLTEVGVARCLRRIGERAEGEAG